jgi:AAA+ ATPase superfamily predicted ATPase
LRFINRDSELTELRDLTSQPGPSMALLYGRRRVGKTFLLDRVWDEDQRFYFLFGDTSDEQNRIELLHEFARWSGRDLAFDDYPTWRTVFRLILTHRRGESWAVVLDEFQYVMDSDAGVVSQLNAIWDRELEGVNVTIVLSGSEVATMAALERADSPLFGRLSWSQRLRPFTYHHAAEMVPHLERREQLYAFGIFGGMPRYLAAIRPDEPLEHAVKRTVLSRTGEVHLQLENVIKQERGIRDHALYRAVLTAVASGATGTNEIAQKSGLDDNLQTRRILESLEDLGLVRREQYFDASRRSGYLNRVADHALAFWYRFVQPNRSQLELGRLDDVWENRIAPHLDDYMGRVFERIAFEAFGQLHVLWGLPGATLWRRWEGTDRNRRSIELDVVAKLNDGQMLTGEVKWSSSPIGPGVHHALSRNLEDLANSGRGWAKDALEGTRIYFSAGGFAPEFRDLAASRDLVLVTLEDLF